MGDKLNHSVRLIVKSYEIGKAINGITRSILVCENSKDIEYQINRGQEPGKIRKIDSILE